MQKNSFTFPLSAAQQETLLDILDTGNFRPMTVPYARRAVEGPDCNIVLYESGKCVVQGKGAQDWVTFTLEPQVLLEAKLGYEKELNPEATAPHMGIDESGKGDFFGPIVIAAAYVDPNLARAFQTLNVRDSKTISSDRKAEEMAAQIRSLLNGRFAIVSIGPRAYNRLYTKIGNVNRLLAWGHARAIENLLDIVPDCPRALSDQFGPTRQIQQALLKKGRSIQLDQRTKAESDPAVAAASILARAAFLDGLKQLHKQYGIKIPKGASPQVREAAVEIVKKHGPQALLDCAKCHFKTTDQVLEAAGSARAALGPEGQAKSRSMREEKEPS